MLSLLAFTTGVHDAAMSIYGFRGYKRSFTENSGSDIYR